MKFGLRNGPWKTLFEGNFQGHEVEILTNPGQVMLVCIYEKEGKEIKGVVLQAFSIFSVVGEAETFVESLQREAIILSRHDGKQTIQFLALGSRPAYAKGEDKEVVKAVDNLLKEIANLGGRLKGPAKNFDLHLTPLEKCSNAVKQAFFSQPTIVPMLVRETKTIELEKEEAVVEKSVEGAAVVFGITKDGKQVKEPLQMFQRALVTDGNLNQRIQVMQIVVESFLLANVPVIIFDKGNEFRGLAYPTARISELQSHGIRLDPIGFPTRDFEPAKNIRINLNVVNPAGLLQMFGCKNKEAEKILKTALDKEKVESPSQLIRNIEKLDSKEAENQFLKRRLERIVNLIDRMYPDMFAGESNVGEIAKSWYKKIGRASIIHIEKTDPRILTLLLDSLSNDLINLFKQKGETGKPKLLFAIPQVEGVFSIRNNIILKDFTKMLSEMKKFGISILIGSERRTDLSREMLQMMETKAGVIKENDVALDLPNSKNYRVLIRPSLSRQKEEKEDNKK